MDLTRRISDLARRAREDARSRRGPLAGASPLAASEAVLETADHLRSGAAGASLRADPYWPKWESPWWRVALLRELGLGYLGLPAAPAIVRALDAKSIRFFPFRAEDAPPGVDSLGIPCHCQLGTIALVLADLHLELDRELPWVRPWFRRYQLPDGGYNCDEAVYLRPAPRSSFLSTLPVAEALLAEWERTGGIAPEDEAVLARAARYLLDRALFRSLSKGGAPAHPAWLTPCFPRFYEYDVLRGLTFVTRWAERAGVPIRAAEVAAVIEALEPLFADGARSLTPRRGDAHRRTLRRDAGGAWLRDQPAGTFPLLDLAASREVAVPILEAEWADALSRLARPGALESR